MAKAVKKEKRTLQLNGFLHSNDWIVEGEEGQEIELLEELKQFDKCDVSITVNYNY